MNAKKRDILGKKVKSIRNIGLIPAVIYGYGAKNTPLELKSGEFLKCWKKAGESKLVELDIDGEKKNVLISEVQVDPLSDQPIHADFHAVRMDEKIRARVPIEFIGESSAVRNLGAVLVKVMHDVEVEALPANLPGEITIDISSLNNFEDRIFIKNIRIDQAVELLANPEDVVVLVTEPKKEEAVLTEEPGIESIEVEEKGKKEKEDEEAPPEKEVKQ